MTPNYLSYARSRIGQREIPGQGSNPYISHCLTKVGCAPDDSIAWCSAFVNDCMDSVGIKGTGKANARSWLDWGRPIEFPVFGCVAIYWRPMILKHPFGGVPILGNDGIHAHVGFWLFELDDEDCNLGGNQNNSVDLEFHKKDKLLGYRLPL